MAPRIEALGLGRSGRCRRDEPTGRLCQVQGRLTQRSLATVGGGVFRHVRHPERALGPADLACYRPALPVRPRQARLNRRPRSNPPPGPPRSPTRPVSGSVGPFPGRSARKPRLRVQKRDLPRSDPDLRRLRRRVRPLGARPGVLRAERVRLGPETLPQLPRGEAVDEGRHGWSGQRARRFGAARVLRRRMHPLRQSGPGPLQAAHGPAGLLLRLLPHRPRPGRIRGFASLAGPARRGRGAVRAPANQRA